jgi:dTMP kinase
MNSPQTDDLTRESRGILVVVDGIDGSGKSTQVRMLSERLRQEGFPSITSCEPTKGPWGEKLRRSALEGRLELDEEFNVICNDRMDDVRNCIQPSLAAGKIVILDRYYTSTLCYQAVRGLAPEAILARNQEFAPVPDLIFILDLDTELALERIRERGQAPDKFETANLALIRERFRSLDLPGLVHLDAGRSPDATHADIHAAVIKAVTSKL